MPSLFGACSSVQVDRAQRADLISLAQVTPAFAVFSRDPTKVRFLAAQAELDEGVNTLRVCGGCEAPPRVTVYSRTINDDGGHHLDQVDLRVRCRRCDMCLKARGMMWKHRAIVEASASPRTWFLTLTFNWRLVDLDEQGAVAFASKQLTNYFKRLRKAGHKFRYLAVFERHKSGMPHIHVLVHCMSKITWRDLNTEWRVGFSSIKLVSNPEVTAGYVTKYTLKARDSVCRIRASVGYGTPAAHGRPQFRPLVERSEYEQGVSNRDHTTGHRREGRHRAVAVFPRSSPCSVQSAGKGGLSAFGVSHRPPAQSGSSLHSGEDAGARYGPPDCGGQGARQRAISHVFGRCPAGDSRSG